MQWQGSLKKNPNNKAKIKVFQSAPKMQKNENFMEKDYYKKAFRKKYLTLFIVFILLAVNCSSNSWVRLSKGEKLSSLCFAEEEEN